MNEVERLSAIEEIKQLKARYFRAVDGQDGALMKTVLAEDCVLDYMGCCTDPKTGVDYFPAMNAVMRGSKIVADGLDGLSKSGLVSVHQGHMFEVEFTGETTAKGIWSMTDRLYLPPGAPYAQMTGYGYYHEGYEKSGGAWRIKTIRIARIRVEGIRAA